MAYVSIDIDAMAQLVRAMSAAKNEINESASTIRGKLNEVMLSTDPLDRLAWGGATDRWIDDSVRDLNRRLSLARLIQASTPSLTVASFDDSVLSTASDAEIKARVSRLVDLMKVDDGASEGRAVDPEVLQILQQNAIDPYFAKELARRMPPQQLDRYLRLVNRGAANPLRADRQPEAFKKEYQELLQSLGTTFSLASRGTGDVAVPGMARQWADLIKRSGGAHTGTANRLSLVIARGQWSDDFLVSTFRAVRDSEGNAGVNQWGVVMPDNAFDPDPSVPGYYPVLDPLRGIFTALQDNPHAMARLFTGGEQHTIRVGGKDVRVNEELFRLLHERTWDIQGMPTEASAVDAFTEALRRTIGAPPETGGTAFQPVLAEDIKNLSAFMDEEATRAKEEAGPLWKQIVHGVLDLAGMIPVLGEPIDLVNGVWYYVDGDVLNGSLSMGSMIPIAGWAVQGGKWTRRAQGRGARPPAGARQGRRGDAHLRQGRQGPGQDGGLTDPATFGPERFLSAAERQRWSGDLEFMQQVIAGNRFNHYANPKYKYSEIYLADGRKGHFRLDAWTPGEAITSRKLTQFSRIKLDTAKSYIDEFVTKYPEGAVIADTPKNRELGIAGKELDGDMILEVPPQIGGKIDQEILDYAEK